MHVQQFHSIYKVTAAVVIDHNRQCVYKRKRLAPLRLTTYTYVWLRRGMECAMHPQNLMTSADGGSRWSPIVIFMSMGGANELLVAS